MEESALARKPPSALPPAAPSSTPRDPSLALTHTHLQPGKVVVVLSGRFAGKKAVIVKNFDDGTSTRPYGHAQLVGLQKEPRKVGGLGVAGAALGGSAGQRRQQWQRSGAWLPCSSQHTPAHAIAAACMHAAHLQHMQRACCMHWHAHAARTPAADGLARAAAPRANHR